MTEELDRTFGQEYRDESGTPRTEVIFSDEVIAVARELGKAMETKAAQDKLQAVMGFQITPLLQLATELVTSGGQRADSPDGEFRLETVDLRTAKSHLQCTHFGSKDSETTGEFDSGLTFSRSPDGQACIKIEPSVRKRSFVEPRMGNRRRPDYMVVVAGSNASSDDTGVRCEVVF